MVQAGSKPWPQVLGQKPCTQVLVLALVLVIAIIFLIKELGKIAKFLHLHCLIMHKVQFFLPTSRVVTTTEATFILEQNDYS